MAVRWQALEYIDPRSGAVFARMVRLPDGRLLTDEATEPWQQLVEARTRGGAPGYEGEDAWAALARLDTGYTAARPASAEWIDGRCPHCFGSTAIDIAYGMPGPDLAAKARRGEVALGGCVIDQVNPLEKCSACGFTW
ncbi:MAG: hypothetical protein QOG53_3097 [Frankiales bacterium]|jgi:hypothetical protein|nr:hypothetical protein [Frankiales bacterium]